VHRPEAHALSFESGGGLGEVGILDLFVV